MVNSVVIAIVGLGAIAWLAVLVSSGSRNKKNDEVPANLSAFVSDDEMESKRLDRVLATAVVASAFMALALPIYYLGESDRQEGFVEEFSETDVEHGHEVWDEFGCAGCHGADGSGGAAAYLEKRSQVNILWAAPAVNDIFYRYDEDEVRFWLVFGRANSPMPAWGLEGGGPMNSQQIDDLMAYLHSIEVPQDQALLSIDTNVTAALDRITSSDMAVADQLADQDELIAEIAASPSLAPIAEGLQAEAEEILDLMDTGFDTDGDGVPDTVEQALSALSERAVAADIIDSAITLDPTSTETTLGIADADAAGELVAAIDAQVVSLNVTADSIDTLTTQAEFGRSFIVDAQEHRNWSVDYPALADATFGGSTDDAQRAVGLFNAYCARCHTAGYSAGPAFQQEYASGALGPSLRDGRANTQFLSADALVDFLSVGSENGIAYGVNGVGSGRMPGFGNVLTAEDLSLIVRYLRGSTLDGVDFGEEAGGA